MTPILLLAAALIAAGEPGAVSSEFLFPLDDRPTPECHASTVVETPSGLVAAWFGGTAEGKRDVGIWLSRRSGAGWSKPAAVVPAAGQDDPCWNPVLFRPMEGPLLLFYKVGPSPDTWWGMLTTSDDDGKTWSPPVRLGENPAVGHLIGPVKNKPIQFKDGSILCPSSSEHDGWRVHFERTADLGKTWTVIGPINDGKTFGAIQPSLLTYPSGSDVALQVLCRSRQGVIVQSWSADGGKTWNGLTATELPNPNSGADAVTLADGGQLLVYNHTVRGGGFPSGRNMLNVALSDDGVRWRQVLTLERAEGEYSYPAVIQTADGLVHVTYTFQRKALKHVVLDPDSLGQPE